MLLLLTAGSFTYGSIHFLSPILDSRRSLRGLQMQNQVISDPDAQRDPIETLPNPPHPTKTSPSKRASDSRAYRIMYQTRQRTLETILGNLL